MREQAKRAMGERGDRVGVSQYPGFRGVSRPTELPTLQYTLDLMPPPNHQTSEDEYPCLEKIFSFPEVR
jgi:hypothetical protein